MEMDSDFSHDPADLARLLEAVRDGADLALGSRYVPGGGVTRLGAAAALHQRGRLDLRALGARPAGPRPDRRLQVLPPRGARGDPLRRRALAGLRLPGRAHLPRRAGGLPRRRGADRLPRPRARARARCPGGSPPRRCGWCRCLRFGPASDADARAAAESRARSRRCWRWMPRPTRSPTACATRARRCAPGSAHPLPVVGRWVAGSALAAAGLLVAVLGRRLARRTAISRSSRCSRRSRSADIGDVLRRPAQQPARARAARDGLRRRLHRRQLAAAAGRAPPRRLALGARARRAHRDRLRRAPRRPSR